MQPESGAFIVTPGYFEALGIPLLHGRDFTWTEGAEGRLAPVIVNRRFARQLWGREDAVGLLASQLYEVRPDDLSAYLAVATLVLVTVVGAAWLPARRAARVDPVQALRQE